jgi:Ca-activated chloride channel family protein
VSFSWPLALALLLLLPFAGLASFLLARRHRAQLARVFSPAFLQRVLPASVRRRRTVRSLALLVGFAGALVAVAEPRLARPPRSVKARGTDIVVLLDLSRSMDAQDVAPSRLVRARRELDDLQKIVEGDRIGLVIYAATAYPRLPLTSDLRALSLVASEVSTDTFQNQGSNLGVAIDAGLELLARTEDQAGKALLVLSDGETHHPDEARAAAERAAEKRIPIYAMGIGIEPVPIPLRSGGFLQDGQTVVTTTPDFEVLEDVASLSGGAFVNSTASTNDLEALYAELRRAVAAVERDTHQGASFDSVYQWPLALGTLGFLVSALLGDGRRAGLVLAVLLSVLAAAPASAASVAEADRAFRGEDWTEAVRQLTELTREDPGNPDLQDRLGAARYRAGDFEGAARAWDAAASSGAGADAWYNAGNAHYQAGRLEDALARYDEALTEDAEHPGATHNRDVVTQELAARRAQKPPPPPKPDEGEKEGDGGEGEQDPNAAGGQQQGEDDQQSEGEGQDPEQQQDQEGQGGGDPGDPTGQGKGQGQPGEGPGEEGEGQGEGEQPRPDGAPTQGGGGIDGEPVPITSAQADRMIEGVEEGKPRTLIRGRTEDKPW